MIYLDSSALVKLVFQETESDALAQWLTERQSESKFSSELATIELIRTCRRYDAEAESGARQVLAGLDLVPLTTDLVESASSAGPPELRSLDAIHLSSALLISEDLTAFVAYDLRLKAAAIAAGLEVAAPV